jgi:hypothetical protein
LVVDMVQLRVPQTLFAFLAMMSSVILFQVLIMLMWFFVGNNVQVSSVNIAIGRNIEQRSNSKLSSAFFDLCREQIAVSRDNVKASLRTDVLLGSFVERNVFLQIGSLKVVVGICRERSHF